MLVILIACALIVLLALLIILWPTDIDDDAEIELAMEKAHRAWVEADARPSAADAKPKIRRVGRHDRLTEHEEPELARSGVSGRPIEREPSRIERR